MITSLIFLFYNEELFQLVKNVIFLIVLFLEKKYSIIMVDLRAIEGATLIYTENC